MFVNHSVFFLGRPSHATASKWSIVNLDYFEADNFFIDNYFCKDCSWLVLAFQSDLGLDQRKVDSAIC